jgi:beta-lactam-binding protein with PASTA domain
MPIVSSSTHSSNSNFTTKVNLTNGALGKVNYEITFTRSSTAWTSFNLYNAGDSRAPYLDVTILGNRITHYWQYDFRNKSTSQTTTRSRLSRLLAVPNPDAFVVGMVRQSGVGIPAGTTITARAPSGSSSVQMSNQATSSGTGVTSWFLQNTNLVQTVITGTVDVTPGVTGTVTGTNNARSTIGSATISGSFTPTAPPPPPEVPAPSAPSNVEIDQIGINNLRLDWSASTGTVSRYRVYKDDVAFDTTDSTTTIYNFTGLSSNTSFTLGVRAEGPDNNSSIVSRTATTLPATFTVPNFNGLTLEQALKDIQGAGFGSVTQTTTTSGATVANNRTVVPNSQSPAAGTTATQGDPISIQFYSFERLVPSIVGLTRSQAESALLASQFSNFSSTLTTSGSTLANNKLVATQSPSSGTSRNILDSVTFEVHDYRIPIPNLANLTRSAAASTLSSAGFTRVTITTTEDGATQQNNNRVFSQSPVNSAITYNPVDQPVSVVVYTLGVVGKKFTGPNTSEFLTTSARYDGTQWVATLVAKRFNGTTWEDIA